MQLVFVVFFFNILYNEYELSRILQFAPFGINSRKMEIDIFPFPLDMEWKILFISFEFGRWIFHPLILFFNVGILEMLVFVF